MALKQIPNVQVWLLGREYLEAAELLVDELRLWPAAILASLALEIFLKSFLAEKDRRGYSSTDHGHLLKTLFQSIPDNERKNILACSVQIDSSIDLVASLDRFNDVFIAARYRYEEKAQKSVGTDIVYFARHVCDTVFLLAKSGRVRAATRNAPT